MQRESPSDEPGSHTTVPPARFVRQLAVAPATLAGLAIGWAALALAGTQIPQADAPLAVSDGLSRADLLAVQALGLHRLASSVPFWLLASLTVLAGVARLLFPEEVALWRGPVGQGSATARLAGAIAAVSAMPTTHTRGGKTRITLGFPVLGPALLLAAGALAAGYAVLAALVPLPVLIDVPVDGQERSVKAWTYDAGSLAAAPGRWRGQCARADDELHCRLDIPGGLPAFALAPGEVVSAAERRFAWVATGRTLDSADAMLRWRPSRAGNEFAVALRAGQVREAPALQARFAMAATPSTGPLVFIQAGPAHARRNLALGSPVLAPSGRPVATAAGPEVARLQVTESVPEWLLLLALLCAAVGGYLAWVRPRLLIEVDEGAAAWAEVRACNRASLLAAVIAAARPSGDAGRRGDGEVA